ncbi:hypothetical protein [Desulfomarina sp.]
MKTVLTKRYDLQGNELARLAKTALLSKWIPLGNFRGGPGARCLVTLAVLHYFGRILYWLLGRHGDRLRLLKKVKNRIM